MTANLKMVTVRDDRIELTAGTVDTDFKRDRRTALAILKFGDKLEPECYEIRINGKGLRFEAKPTQWAVSSKIRKLWPRSNRSLIEIRALDRVRDGKPQKYIWRVQDQECSCAPSWNYEGWPMDSLRVFTRRFNDKEFGYRYVCRHNARAFWANDHTARMYARVVYG